LGRLKQRNRGTIMKPSLYAIDFVNVAASQQSFDRSRARFIFSVALAFAVAATAGAALADEGGVSFWLPGEFGSLAATPQVPGWAWA
jgi:hypothetical protein